MLENKYLKNNIFYYKKVDSTNNIAKKLAIKGVCEGTTVIANQQTAGRGRLGRTFLSLPGGVYFSVVLRPKSSIKDTIFLTVAAATAAAQAIEKISGKKCDIKWVNDIYIENKKVCGILAEGEMNQNGELNYCILGIGINLFEPKNKFPSELPFAASIFKKRKCLFKNRLKRQVVIEFLNCFFKIYNNLEQKKFIKEYQMRSMLTGKIITYTKNSDTHTATVKGIDDNARLVVEENGQNQVLSHGEIQIVGMEQLLI